MRVRRELVSGDYTGADGGEIRIICGGRGKTIKVSVEADEYYTLNDCLREIEWKRGDPPVIVIFDNYLYGKIYRYGYSTRPKWEEYGETKGFA